MIERAMLARLQARLAKSACVVLLGAPLIGKSVLAEMLSKRMDGLYLDLGRAEHRAMLEPDPGAFLAGLAGRLVVLDGIHQQEALFDLLKDQVEIRQRLDISAGHFVLLGDSRRIRAMASQRLAGHLEMIEVPGLAALDLPLATAAITDDRMAVDVQAATPMIDPHADEARLWIRGGYPRSYLADNDQISFEWRSHYLQALTGHPFTIEGEPVAQEAVQRTWSALAGANGTELNTARISDALGCNGPNARRFVDHACDLRALRRLPRRVDNERAAHKAWPKIYFRDSGLLHACLGLPTCEAVEAHDIAGNSWEGFVIEAALSALPAGTRCSWYRSDNNEEELDLVVERDNQVWGIEIKKSKKPGVSKGFYAALEKIGAKRAIVIYRGNDRYVPDKRVEFMSLRDIMSVFETF